MKVIYTVDPHSSGFQKTPKNLNGGPVFALLKMPLY